MTINEALFEMQKFTKLKTTMEPVFVGVIKKYCETSEPVIHCKECKHRDPEDHKCDGGFWHAPIPMKDNDFCSYGEKGLG